VIIIYESVDIGEVASDDLRYRHVVTTDGVWIGNRIYWALKHHVTTHYKHYHTRTNVLSHGFTAVRGSGFQRRTFPSLWVPELSLASATATLS
jgi:hypothetical protein